MPTPDLCTEDEVVRLVHGFYARVRQDPELGPVFDAHIGDWDHHLSKMVDFWSSTLRGTKRYRGTPMPAHVALPDLNPGMFHRWLALFDETVRGIGNPAMQARANELARRIAESLWFGYQMHRDPQRIARSMSH